MYSSIIHKIAKKYGVSTAEVRREMQLAINAAYENPGAEAISVPRKRAIPGPQELIAYCASEIAAE